MTAINCSTASFLPQGSFINRILVTLYKKKLYIISESNTKFSGLDLKLMKISTRRIRMGSVTHIKQPPNTKPPKSPGGGLQKTSINYLSNSYFIYHPHLLSPPPGNLGGSEVFNFK